jgi:hypothetical protein
LTNAAPYQRTFLLRYYRKADAAGLWPQTRAVLGADAKPLEGDGPAARAAIGIVGWTRASRAEVAELPGLRARHDGPLVAILAAQPSTRSSRAVAARVEGSVLATELQRSRSRPANARSWRWWCSTNAEIAAKLYVSESSVKSHLTSAFTKLGVTSCNAATELILDSESGLGPGILRISPEE